MLLSEILSLFHALAPLPVGIAWGLVDVIALIAWWRVRRRPIVSPIRFVDRTGIGWSLAGGTGAILLATFITAIVSPPNNWDSMTYHMARIAHWVQNGTLAPYPTTILRQLHQNPAAELMILQFQVLTGGDRLANLIQWGALLGSALGASLLAKQLGATGRGQVLAAAFVVSLPMAVLQASNTQNDIVLGFYLIAFASFLLWAIEDGRPLGIPIGLAGAALGLAVLTKATGYLFAFPLCVWFATVHLRRFKLRAVPAGIAIALILVLLNLGHGLRNASLYGSPFGPGQEVAFVRTYTYTNDAYTVRGTISNVIRNAALQLATGQTGWNAGVIRGVVLTHNLIGADVNDPATTWQGAEFYLFTPGWNHSDYAANPLHFVLFLAAACSLPWIARPQRWTVVVLFVCVAMGFVLFAGVLRWQPWHARLHLPLFLLAAGPIGAVMGRIWPALLAWLVGLILLLAAWVPLLYSATQPWTGSNAVFGRDRTSQYFTMRPGLLPFYREIVQTARQTGATCVALRTDDDDYEYPLFRMLHAVDPSIRIQQMDVENESAAADAVGRCEPDLIVDLRGDVERIVLPVESGTQGNKEKGRHGDTE